MRHTMVMPNVTGAWFRRHSLRPLLGALFLLLLGWGSAAPASADLTVDGSNSSAASPYTIDASNSPFSGAITVNSGGYLNIVDGAQISAGISAVVAIGGTVDISGGSISGGTAYGVVVHNGATVTISDDATISGGDSGVGVFGGALSISGGSISGGRFGVTSAGGTASITGGSISAPSGNSVNVVGGTLSISGGSISGGFTGVALGGGALSISGGSISGGTYGVGFAGGALSINGCNLRLAGTQLIGTLQDGSLINTPTYQLGPQHLANQDTGALEIACPPNVTTQAPSGACSASLNPGTATASDGCSTPPVVGGVRGDGLSLTDPYPVGSTTITWMATSAAGSASCSQTITVRDTTPPTITLNGGNPLTVECHSRFSDPGATATDDCAGSFPASASGTVDVNTPGSYTLTYTATDSSGNAATPVTRTVTLVDTTPPVVTAPANISQSTGPGQCSAQVAVGMATATDTCAGALTQTGTRSDGQALSAPYPVGSTTITWSTTDPAGNPASATQTVTVADQQAPTITCPGNQSVQSSGSGAVVNFTVPASDNCPGVSVTATPPSGSAFPEGTTTVNCTATDAAGNTATCSFTVTVQPAAVPTADLSLAMSASPSPVASGSQLTYTITATNNGPQAAQGVLLVDPLPSGTSFVSASRNDNIGTLATSKGKNSAITWNVNTLASSQSVTLTVVVKVSAKAGDTISNTATVNSSSPLDPNAGNNSSSVTTPVIGRR